MMEDDQTSLAFANSRSQVSSQMLSALVGLGTLSVSVSLLVTGTTQSPDAYYVRFVLLGVGLMLLGYDLATSRASTSRAVQTSRSGANLALSVRPEPKVFKTVLLLAVLALMFIAIAGYSIWGQYRFSYYKNLAAKETSVTEATVVNKFTGHGRYSTRQILIYSPEARKQEWFRTLPEDFNRLNIGDKIEVYVRPETLEIIPATLEPDTHLTAALIIPMYMLLLFLYFAIFRDRALRLIH